MTKTRIVCTLLIGGLLCSFPYSYVAAQTKPPVATATSEAAQAPAGKFIQDLGNQALAVIADKNLSQQQRTDKYHSILHDAFDVPTIAHFVVGRAWDSAPPEQQQQYLKLFEGLVIKIYSDRLNFYSGEGFNVKGTRPETDKDTIVNSEITHPGGTAPTTVDWRVRQKDGKLLIVDVVVEGVSQSVTQRQEYSSITQRDGGKLDALIAKMQQQLQGDNSGGAAQQ